MEMLASVSAEKYVQMEVGERVVAFWPILTLSPGIFACVSVCECVFVS